MLSGLKLLLLQADRDSSNGSRERQEVDAAKPISPFEADQPLPAAEPRDQLVTEPIWGPATYVPLEPPPDNDCINLDSQMHGLSVWMPGQAFLDRD